jgi:hypothetical protein
MARRSHRKPVDSDCWKERLAVVREFLTAARQDYELAEPGAVAIPILSHAVHGAISHGECATAFRARVVDQQDHGFTQGLLREIL